MNIRITDFLAFVGLFVRGIHPHTKKQTLSDSHWEWEKVGYYNLALSGVFGVGVNYDFVSFYILKIGLGLVFIATGVFIFRSLDKWGLMIRTFAARIVPVRTALIITALFDMAVGFFLVLPYLSWLSALLAGLHLIQVLITVEFNDATYRDMGLLAASAAILILSRVHGW